MLRGAVMGVGRRWAVAAAAVAAGAGLWRRQALCAGSQPRGPEKVEERDVALVTGAGGVIGAATVSMLLARNYRVVAMDVSAEALQFLEQAQQQEQRGEAEGKRGEMMCLEVDITDKQQVSRAVQRVEEAWGDVSVLVSTAGILTNAKLMDTTPQLWQRVMSVNVEGHLYVTQALVPGMRRRAQEQRERTGASRASIVFITSMASKTGGVTAGTAYATSKGAMTSLVFSLAKELAKDDITVNGLAPAYVRGPMVDALTQEQQEGVLQLIPLHRFCEPTEVAEAVRFLVTCRFCTSEILDLNGGVHPD